MKDDKARSEFETELLARVQELEEAIRILLWRIESNSGHEPDFSIYNRALDEAFTTALLKKRARSIAAKEQKHEQ